MKRMMMAGLAALALGGGLAGCTPDDISSVSQGVSTTCNLLPIGTTIGVQIASTVIGAPVPPEIVSMVTQDVSSVCSGVTQATAAIVQQIEAQGGTAKVTVTTTTPRGLVRRRTMVFRP